MFVMAIVAATMVLVLQHATQSQACTLRRASSAWEGTCGPLFEARPTLAVSPTPKVTTGRWQQGRVPTAIWAGQMSFARGSIPIEIEVYAEGPGVLRTSVGWVLITAFSRSDDSLHFELDTAHPVPPSDLDRDIVQRAAAILSTEAVWDRADDRQCAPADQTWSIYCALHRASLDITDGFHHRRPALQVVRQIVQERSAGRNYAHRLQDYNNDSLTGLTDVHSLFAEALTRMRR